MTSRQDLLSAQDELRRTQAALTELSRDLPWSVDPMEGWERPAPRRDDSPGYSEQQRADMQRLTEEARKAAEAVSTHPNWDGLSGRSLVEARMRLKHVHEPDSAEVG
ncbi:hypothetical protein DSC45_34220 [Streptomyces sp. YIM 130001]|uniref:hypothetical protein n=1 Tax=Streptomyces sp. YIM 130001 TaxID=2259644 RepID=UPI000E6595EF|nr:hypothetical protein [Streptomyces sp. YIM 130001]RII07973.1 hypothetical protein DSC45_34220 [Streptomyces sp. YIM 130001]